MTILPSWPESAPPTLAQLVGEEGSWTRNLTPSVQVLLARHPAVHLLFHSSHRRRCSQALYLAAVPAAAALQGNTGEVVSPPGRPAGYKGLSSRRGLGDSRGERDFTRNPIFPGFLPSLLASSWELPPQ